MSVLFLIPRSIIKLLRRLSLEKSSWCAWRREVIPWGTWHPAWKVRPPQELLLLSAAPLGQNLSQELALLSLSAFWAHFHSFPGERGSVHNIEFLSPSSSFISFSLWLWIWSKVPFPSPGSSGAFRCKKNGQTIPKLGKHQPAEIWGIWKRGGPGRRSKSHH